MLHTSLIVCVYYGRYIRQVIVIFAKTEIADICRKQGKWLDIIALFISRKVRKQMQTVIINIDDEDYDNITLTGENTINLGVLLDLREAVRKGKPLPKNHGRLIDADYLREDFKASKRISFAERMDISCIVDHAPTIIEADEVKE